MPEGQFNDAGNLKLLKEEISSIAWQEIQPNRYMN